MAKVPGCVPWPWKTLATIRAEALSIFVAHGECQRFSLYTTAEPSQVRVSLSSE